MRRRKLDNYAKYLKYIFIAAPALACFYLVWRYGVNMIYSDEWFMAGFGKGLQAGTLTFADLWGSLNEHRQFFFRLVYLAAAFLTGFNSKALLAVSLAVVCAGYFVMIRYLFAMVRDELWRCAGGLALGLLMFSPVQYENFLWGFQLAFLMADILPLISMYFLHRRLTAGKQKYLVFALALGVVASFSSAQGLLVWPAALAMLALRYRKAVVRQAVAVAWLAVGAASWFFYFFKLGESKYGTPLPSRRRLLYLMKHPMPFLHAAARMATRPLLTRSPWFILISCLCLLAVTGVAVFFGFRLATRTNGNNFFPGALMLFGILSALVVSVSRDIQMADASRYTTATLCIYTGLVLYFLVNRELFKKKIGAAGRFLTRTAAALLTAIVVVSTAAWPVGAIACQYFSARMTHDAAIIRGYKTAEDEELLQVFAFHGPGFAAMALRDWVPFLEENGYSVFAEQKK